MNFNRRHFMRLSAGVCAASAFTNVFATENEALLNIKPLTLSIGLEKPFRAFHISDTHLTLADERENERKKVLAEGRSRYFSKSVESFDASLAHAQKNNELLLHTGDLIDFVSEKNLDWAAEKFQGRDTFVSSGNHEFSQYVGEAKEDAAYKAQSYERVQRAYPNDLTFCSRVIHGVNFIALDDVYYNFTEEQLKRFQEEVKRGLPIVMMCHVPLYTPNLFDMMVNQKHTCAYVTGAPEELIKGYSKHRFEQQRADAPTLNFIAYLKEQPLLKAILCGHLHFFWEERFSPTAMQYVVGGNYNGDAYEITLE